MNSNSAQRRKVSAYIKWMRIQFIDATLLLHPWHGFLVDFNDKELKAIN
jgi:hypothetical protein